MKRVRLMEMVLVGRGCDLVSVLKITTPVLDGEEGGAHTHLLVVSQALGEKEGR